MTMRNIPFKKASLLGGEQGYVLQAVGRGHISGNDLFSKQCRQLLERELGVSKALLTTSCTHALGQRLGGRPGDCPVTGDVSDRLLRRPFCNDLTVLDEERVAAIHEFSTHRLVRTP
jgi:hypothetical protein